MREGLFTPTRVVALIVLIGLLDVFCILYVPQFDGFDGGRSSGSRASSSVGERTLSVGGDGEMLADDDARLQVLPSVAERQSLNSQLEEAATRSRYTRKMALRRNFAQRQARQARRHALGQNGQDGSGSAADASGGSSTHGGGGGGGSSSSSSSSSSGGGGGSSASSSISASSGGSDYELPLKIFVYDLPMWANAKILRRNPWCEGEVFGTEQFFHQAIMNNTFGVRTWDPEEADYFYVPIYATCLVYRDFGNFAKYRYLVERVLQHVVEDYPYWTRSHGRDHIWPFVHDFGGCLSWLDNTDHVYFENLRHSIFLSHLGDLSLGCFMTYKDVVIPPMVSDPALISAAPSLGPRGGKGPRGGATIRPSSRKTFAHFRGTVRWRHQNAHPELGVKRQAGDVYSNGVRQLLLDTYKDDPLVQVYEGSSDTYMDEVRDSVFCLCPRGFATWSRRFYDSVLLGCIPVIIADNIELPFEASIDYRAFTVKIAEKDAGRTKEILLGIPREAIREKQRVLMQVWRHFTYQRPPQKGDAFDMTMRRLVKRLTNFPVAGGRSWY